MTSSNISMLSIGLSVDSTVGSETSGFKKVLSAVAVTSVMWCALFWFLPSSRILKLRNDSSASGFLVCNVSSLF